MRAPDTQSPRHFLAAASRPRRIFRLYRIISSEWAGHPLHSLQAMMSYIEGTTTNTGLKVIALLDKRAYVKGKAVPDQTISCSKPFPYRTIQNCRRGITQFVPTEDG
jgi:hypothetical protein